MSKKKPVPLKVLAYNYEYQAFRHADTLQDMIDHGKSVTRARREKAAWFAMSKAFGKLIDAIARTEEKP